MQTKFIFSFLLFHTNAENTLELIKKSPSCILLLLQKHLVLINHIGYLLFQISALLKDNALHFGLNVTYNHVYLYDCRFRDECVSFHHFYHSLRHHSLLHACHIEAIYVIPECNAVLMLLCVTHCRQADVTKVWIDCGEMKGERGVNFST